MNYSKFLTITSMFGMLAAGCQTDPVQQEESCPDATCCCRKSVRWTLAD